MASRILADVGGAFPQVSAGGPGLFVARATGAKLVGLDLSSVGMAIAAQRAQRVDIAAEFVVASITTAGAIPGPVDGAMSIDSLQYVPDKRAAFAEIRTRPQAVRPLGLHRV